MTLYQLELKKIDKCNFKNFYYTFVRNKSILFLDKKSAT